MLITTLYNYAKKAKHVTSLYHKFTQR